MLAPAVTWSNLDRDWLLTVDVDCDICARGSNSDKFERVYNSTLSIKIKRNREQFNGWVSVECKASMDGMNKQRALAIIIYTRASIMYQTIKSNGFPDNTIATRSC